MSALRKPTPTPEPSRNLRPVQDQPEPVVFDYVAKLANENTVKGYLDALSEEDARQILTSSGLRVISLKRGRGTRKKKRRRFGPADVARVAQALGAHRESGRNWTEALLEVSRTTSHPKVKTACARAADEIAFNGKEPHDALAAQAIFPDKFVTAVRLGLKSGKDREMLEKMRKDFLRIATMLKQIRKAMTYPGIVAGAAVIAFTFMMIFFVPAMKNIFEGMLAGGDTSLPLPTRIVIHCSDIVVSPYGAAIFAFIIGGGYGLWYYANHQGKEQWERLQLELPKIGPLLRHLNAADAARSISTLYGAISLTENIKETGLGMTNHVYRNIFEHMHAMMIGTQSTVPPLDRIMTPFARQLGYNITTVCSNSMADGKIDFHFGNHADELDAHVTESIDNLVEFIQPAFIVIICSVVGGVIISLYMPLFELIGRMAGK